VCVLCAWVGVCDLVYVCLVCLCVECVCVHMCVLCLCGVFGVCGVFVYCVWVCVFRMHMLYVGVSV